MTTILLPRLLLIAGNGRESGKTTLACSIIQKFSITAQLVALKISPHQHKVKPGGRVMVNDSQLIMIEETLPGTDKDSLRMLAAGAARSFFIMAADDQLRKAIEIILDTTGSEVYFVCESGGLRNWVEPGLFFIINRNEQVEINPGTRELMKWEHSWISFDGLKPDFDISRISINNNQWIMQNSHDNI
jgi:hypothetical protein